MVRDSDLRSATRLLPGSIIRLLLLLTVPGLLAQKVKVEPEVVSYPGQTVTLRCRFPDPGQTQLTQVSWILETDSGTRTNIAVFHPTYGVNYPLSPVEGRVSFLVKTPSLESPTIQIRNIALTDEGRYICEYAAYPTGNEKGVTSLIILAKPENSASVITVRAGKSPVAVASCESAKGRPAAAISWATTLSGNGSKPVQTENQDNTVTVRSDYMLTPSRQDNGKEISCMVSHRTLDKPETFPMKLVIEYQPVVKIEGYDNNWYIGRTNVRLTCIYKGNPAPDSVDWIMGTNPMPDTVVKDQDTLTVQKVDESVNTTFSCEAKNSVGTGRASVTVVVRGKPLIEKGSATGSIIGGIIGVILVIALIVTVVLLVQKHRRNADGPPRHKPPPPKKHTKISYSDVQPQNSNNHSNNRQVYYETQREEPVTDLDSYHDDADDEPSLFDPHTSPRLEDEEMLPPYYELRENEVGVDVDEPHENPSSLSREDSFMSAPMIV